jgi:hypothetical protein
MPKLLGEGRRQGLIRKGALLETRGARHLLSTADRYWAYAKVWLYSEIAGAENPAPSWLFFLFREARRDPFSHCVIDSDLRQVEWWTRLVRSDRICVVGTQPR